MAKKYNCTINGKQYFRITKTVGHKADGTPIRKTFYGDGEKDANEKAESYINKIKSGLTIDFENVTLDSLMSKWIYDIKKYDNIKPSTFQSYEGTYRNYIKTSDIAGLKLFNVKSIHLQEYYNKMSKNGISSSKIKKMNKLLYQFFEYAIYESYLNRNPADNIVIPKLKEEKVLKEEEIEYFNTYEIKILKEAIKGTDIELLVLFALGTGLRQGELLALRYSDIDYEQQQLKVNRTVKKVYVFDDNNNKIQETLFLEPKTSNSKRVVDIPSSLFDFFKITKGVNKSDNLIFDDNGNVLEARKLFRRWSKILRDNNIPHKKFHALRHTYATLLLSKGVDLLTVSKLLGHSSLKITEIYTHIIPQLKQSSVNKINDIFDN